MASVIKAGNATNGAAISSDNTGILELKSGTGSGTTAITIGTNQAVTFAGAVTSSGNQTVTGNLTVDGNTTLGNANTDTILMTAAPSIGGAGLGMGFGFRNRIINGNMVIDQRNAGASVSLSSDGAYAVDRWNTYEATDAVVSIQQVADAPSGFVNSLKVTVTTADASVGASQFCVTRQMIEGNNVADLGWGTASAQTVTLSFWVKSTLTGTFGGVLHNSVHNRSYPFTYTISSASTWEQKTVTVAGDTSGTWLTTNGVGLGVEFGLGVGSTYSGTSGSWAGSTYFSATGATNVVSTLNATWQITGVQLEKGSTATSFDYRPYGTELQLCQRYFQKYVNQPSAYQGNGNLARNGYLPSFIYPVKMRTAPTASNITGNVAGNGTTYAFSSPSVTTTADGLSELFGATSTAIGYSEPFCIYFTTLDLSAEL